MRHEVSVPAGDGLQRHVGHTFEEAFTRSYEHGRYVEPNFVDQSAARY